MSVCRLPYYWKRSIEKGSSVHDGEPFRSKPCFLATTLDVSNNLRKLHCVERLVQVHIRATLFGRGLEYGLIAPAHKNDGHRIAFGQDLSRTKFLDEVDTLHAGHVPVGDDKSDIPVDAFDGIISGHVHEDKMSLAVEYHFDEAIQPWIVFRYDYLHSSSRVVVGVCSGCIITL
jgi:hypothetical protein